MANGILVCGLNGSGKSTLGRALAKALNYRFIDIEDLYFPKDDPEYLYANPRPFEEVKDMLTEMTAQCEPFVLASVKGNFGAEVLARIEVVVRIEAAKELRVQRVHDRSYSKFGERMCLGGDLYERESAFFDMVKSRDEGVVDGWLSSVSCPVIRVDGALPICDNVARLVAWLHGKG